MVDFFEKILFLISKIIYAVLAFLISIITTLCNPTPPEEEIIGTWHSDNNEIVITINNDSTYDCVIKPKTPLSINELNNSVLCCSGKWRLGDGGILCSPLTLYVDTYTPLTAELNYYYYDSVERKFEMSFYNMILYRQVMYWTWALDNGYILSKDKK